MQRNFRIGVSVAALMAVGAATQATAEPLGLYFGASSIVAMGEAGLTSDGFYIPPPGGEPVANNGSLSENFDVEGGGLNLSVGYMTEFGNFIVGGELSTMLGSMQTDMGFFRAAGRAFGYGDGYNFGAQHLFEIDQMMEIRALLGMNVGGGFSLFGTAGFAAAQGESAFFPVAVQGQAAAAANGFGTQSHDMTGYSLGVGGMYSLNDNAALTLRYSYTDFGSYNIRSPLVPAAAATAIQELRQEVDVTLGRVEAGFIVSF